MAFLQLSPRKKALVVTAGIFQGNVQPLHPATSAQELLLLVFGCISLPLQGLLFFMAA